MTDEACSNVEDVAATQEQKDSTAEDMTPVEKQDPDHDLKQTAQHLEEMGLGSAAKSCETPKLANKCRPI